MIKGTVLDNSPAQPGTPCVSKDSMTTQMEYLHMQHPIDGVDHNATITGVPVSIDAVDPNGNYIHIGDTTTDGYSGTFGFTWTPANRRAIRYYRILQGRRFIRQLIRNNLRLSWAAPPKHPLHKQKL